ncbi:MAG: hypothetical protein ACHQCH_02345 [Solirubrobacterales bacterium]
MSSMPPTPPAPDAYPDWDGIPRDELPLRLTSGLDLIVTLEGTQNFPAAGALSEILNWGTISHIRGGEITANNEQHDAIARLWVPAFEDQTTDAPEDADHVPIHADARWAVAELAFAALAAALPHRSVFLGFLTNDDDRYMLPWREYCQHYEHPPEYALGYWEL